jgi:hypothetical protein
MGRPLRTREGFRHWVELFNEHATSFNRQSLAPKGLSGAKWLSYQLAERQCYIPLKLEDSDTVPAVNFAVAFKDLSFRCGHA